MASAISIDCWTEREPRSISAVQDTNLTSVMRHVIEWISQIKIITTPCGALNVYPYPGLWKLWLTLVSYKPVDVLRFGYTIRFLYSTVNSLKQILTKHHTAHPWNGYNGYFVGFLSLFSADDDDKQTNQASTTAKNRLLDPVQIHMQKYRFKHQIAYYGPERVFHTFNVFKCVQLFKKVMLQTC